MFYVFRSYKNKQRLAKRTCHDSEMSKNAPVVFAAAPSLQSWDRYGSSTLVHKIACFSTFRYLWISFILNMANISWLQKLPPFFFVLEKRSILDGSPGSTIILRVKNPRSRLLQGFRAPGGHPHGGGSAARLRQRLPQRGGAGLGHRLHL